MGSLRSMMRGLFYPERGVSMDKYRKMSERAEEGFNLVLREVERNNRLLAQNDRLLDKIELLITDHVASTQTIRELTQRLDDVCESWEEDVSTIKKLENELRADGLRVTIEEEARGEEQTTH